jgi:hypothetical protein
VEEISLNLTTVQMDYKEQKLDETLGGAVSVFYNVKANRGG